MKIPQEQWEAIEPMFAWTRERLRTARESRGWTQVYVGGLMDSDAVCGTRISDFETGRNDAKMSTMFRYARVLGVNMASLFNGAPTWRGRAHSDKGVVVMTKADLESIIRANSSPAVAEKIISAIDVTILNKGL